MYIDRGKSRIPLENMDAYDVIAQVCIHVYVGLYGICKIGMKQEKK